MAERDTEIDKNRRADLDEKLKGMNKRLGRNDNAKSIERSRRRNSQGMALALRVASEFVSAILVGALIGYGIDWLLGTKPWVMIVFLLLGFVAGVMNIMRSADEFSQPYNADNEENEGS